MRALSRVLYGLHDLRRAYWRTFEPTVVGVRALVLGAEGAELMLVRHSYLSGWYLPGGKVDRGETAHDAVCREVAEECALRAERARLLGVYANREQNRNDHILLYEIRAFAAGPRPSLWHRLEIAEARFFPITRLPPDTTPATLRRLAEHHAARPVPVAHHW